jgi:predicted small integral membrane protein
VKVLRSKWEDNIEMDLKGKGYEGLGWINLIQDRDKWRDFVNSLINLLGVSNGAGNFFD